MTLPTPAPSSRSTAPRVLCVDDEPHVLGGLTRVLRRDYNVTTAVGGAAGIDALLHDGPFAVVVSDMRMPGVDGVAVLSRAREVAPHTVRVLLTGQADLSAAIAAVNDGQIFRFMTKPCPPDTLLRGLEASVRQHQLLTAERELLEGTLQGSIRVVTDMLAVVFPEASSRAARAQQNAALVMDHLGVADRWHIDIAAMLSQLGAITLPPMLARKLYAGTALTEAEQAIVDKIPAFNKGLLADIPRLEPVRQALTYLNKRFDGQGPPRDGVHGEDIPFAARLLKVALDFDVLQSQGIQPDEALRFMRDREGWYDPRILDALAVAHAVPTPAPTVREVSAAAVEPGMVSVDEVRSDDGRVVMTRGQPVTLPLAERLRNLNWAGQTSRPVRVALPRPREA